MTATSHTTGTVQALERIARPITSGDVARMLAAQNLQLARDLIDVNRLGNALNRVDRIPLKRKE